MRRALAFLTPFGRSAVPSPDTLGWFPLVGALIGLAVGSVWWLAAKAWTPVGAAAIALAADVAFTGYLHLDGLADSADGLLPPMDARRRLEVMADPAVGAFGLVTVVVVLLLRFAAFASASPSPLAVAALWCGSRTAMAAVAQTVPYARPGGLASAFIEPVSQAGVPGDDRAGGGPRRAHRDPGAAMLKVSTLLGIALAAGLAFGGRGVHGIVALVGELVGVVIVVLFSSRRIGGFTGDVLGAAGVVGETAGLLVLAATL
jgi:adenosylcobinamide-GDP ribazoletransferase